MLIAAMTLAKLVSVEELAEGRVYPKVETIRTVSAVIAAAVGEDVYSKNLATVFPKPTSMLDFMTQQQFDVSYPNYTVDSKNTHLVIVAD
mmetsp:Transcript_8153/g.22625  ORF Transcript_8153/g.22625 Transcript_8153/m.22625 type:complete len:90 (+) Transcript_8153:1600-1869(+)